MKAPAKTAAVAACLLTALLAGCGRQSAATRPTVQSCTSYGVYAIQHHITVKWQPAQCRGLTKAQINFAVGRAIYAVAGSGQHKAAWRKRARAAGALLAHMVSAVPRPSSAPQVRAAASSGPASPSRHGGATGIAALIVWVITASIGGYMLAQWISHGGLRRSRTSRSGLPPVVIFSHFGMAVTGLLAWILYVVTNASFLAWTALGLLMPITGLGMVLVTLSAPARFLAGSGAGGPGTPAMAAAGSGGAGSGGAGSGGAGSGGAGSGGAGSGGAGSGSSGSGGARPVGAELAASGPAGAHPEVTGVPAVPDSPTGSAAAAARGEASGPAGSRQARRHMPWMVAGHGVAATLTILLALLAVLSAR